MGLPELFGDPGLIWDPLTIGTPGTFLGPPELFGPPGLILDTLEFGALKCFGTPGPIWDRWDLFLDYFGPPETIGTPGAYLGSPSNLGAHDIFGTPLDY